MDQCWADAAGVFPNEASTTRLIGAMPAGQNDKWQTDSRHVMVAAFARIGKEKTAPILGLSTKAARSGQQADRENTPP